jgi:AraC family transcriptional regulator, regulatory protein of adaptative response / methylated-DNA-[protein]-cysteine methyltransferase
MSTQDPQLELVQRVCRYIEDHFEDSTTLAEISAHVHLSPYHLQRTFKRVMGITPRQYAEACRLEHLKACLREGDNVTQALYHVGYGSSSRLYEQAPEKLGMTPATYRNGGAGMSIHYSIVNSPLGRLLVGKTDRGICAVSLGEHDDDLEATLYSEYPCAEVCRDQMDFCEWVAALLDHLEGWQPHLDLPLDVQATAFEWRVWQELQAIPYGETRTYKEIATAIGQPNAAAAVARAVCANRTAVIIPCHRASREDGKASHFYNSRRSIKSKQRLLDHEQHVTEQQVEPTSEPA